MNLSSPTRYLIQHLHYTNHIFSIHRKETRALTSIRNTQIYRHLKSTDKYFLIQQPYTKYFKFYAFLIIIITILEKSPTNN